LRLTRTSEVRRRTSILWVAIAAIALVGATQSRSQVLPNDETTPSGNVSGTVLNSVTHEPIGRALVYSSDGRFATFTDDHGHFELSGALPMPIAGQPNAYVPIALMAKKPGFLSDPMQRGGEAIAASQKEITLPLVPEGLIVGRVKFPTAETADHVQVQLYRREVRNGFAQWTQLTATETRSDGDFRFSGLRAGAYKVFTLESQDQDPLTAVPNGPFFVFPPRYFAAASDFSTADIIQVRAGESFTANIALESQRYFEVKVPVTGLDPTVPMGLEVSVHAQGHRGPGFELGYDASQGAITGSLPNGNYTLEASGYGPTAVTGMVNITIANRPVYGPALAVAPNTSIEVNIHQDMTGADAERLPRNLGSQNQPAAYVTLMSAEEVSSQRGAGGFSQAQGTPPVLAGVPPGRYWVQIQNGEGYPAYVTSGSRDLLRLPLIVPYGASVPPIEITMRYDTGEIEVAVEPSAKQATNPATPNASSIGYAQETMFQPGRLTIYGIPTGDADGVPTESHRWSNGNYILDRLAPGDYLVLALITRQEFEYRNPAAMRAYESKGRVVHVSPGQKTQVQVQVVESE
jgi:hypothetical protein